jgi:hypothetical protein
LSEECVRAGCTEPEGSVHRASLHAWSTSLPGAVTSSRSTPRARNPPNTTAPNTVMIFSLPLHNRALPSVFKGAQVLVIPRRRVAQIPNRAGYDLRAPPRLRVWATPPSALADRAGGAIRCRGFKRGVAQLGSALRSGRRGRRFKSCHPDLKLQPLFGASRGRKKLDESKSTLTGGPASTIAAILGVTRATIYRVLAGEQ